MKKIISLILTLAMVLGCVTLLASCGAPKDAGAEISVYLGEEIYDFDHTDYYVSSNQESVMSLLFDPLFGLSSSGKLEKNGAAKSYKIDREERTIVIELRETHWSDEQRVSAEDYIYAWRNVLLEPTNANPAAALLYDIENASEIKNGTKSIYEFGAVASDVYEITITYREGADTDRLLKNLASIATAPIRQDIYDNADGYWTKVLNYAITNGPFRIETVDYEEGSFTLARNVGYHQLTTVTDYTKQVTPSKLVSFTTPDDKALSITYKDIEDKAVFYMSDATLADRAANKDKAKVADQLSTYTYVFNTEKPLFAIKEVRQALSMVIDRNSIIDAITFGKPATGFLPAGVLDGDGSIRKNNDLISAEAKVNEAAELLKGVDFTGIEKKITLTVSNSEEEIAIANLVKLAWSSLGFEVTVEAVGSTQHDIVDFKNSESIKIYDSSMQLLVKEAAQGKRDFDVIGIDWQMYSTDAFVALTSLSGNFNGCGTTFDDAGFYGSIGGWKSAEYDLLIAEAYAATDTGVRAEKLHAAEALAVGEAAVCPLVFNQSFAFVGKDLSGVKFDGFGYVAFEDVSQRNYRKYLYQ